MPKYLKDNGDYIFGCTAMFVVLMYCFIHGAA